jgi:hypothetical protein
MRDPRSPLGRNTRMRIRIPKTIEFVHRVATYWSLIERTTPITIPPSIAPGRLPMPPSTAAVKASIPDRNPSWK